MTELVRAGAVLEPPQKLYMQEETGEVSVIDPRLPPS
jgi:hypothetical protein